MYFVWILDSYDKTKDLQYWNNYTKEKIINEISRRPFPYMNTVIYCINNNKYLDFIGFNFNLAKKWKKLIL